MERLRISGVKTFLTINLLFCLLLTVSAKFKVNILAAAGENKHESKVTKFGTQVHGITAEERKAFGITDEKIMKAIVTIMGAEPTNQYYNGPTDGCSAPKGDLYKHYGWQPVLSIYDLTEATIINLKSTPAVIGKQTFVNSRNHTDTPKVTVTLSCETSHESTFSSKHTIGKDVNVGLNVLVFAMSSAYKYDYQWGTDTTSSKKETVTIASEVASILPPKSRMKVDVAAHRGTMTVRCVYKTSFSGCMALNYYYKARNHHYWCLDYTNVLEKAGLPTYYVTTNDIEIGFYADIELRTYDPQ